MRLRSLIAWYLLGRLEVRALTRHRHRHGAQELHLRLHLHALIVQGDRLNLRGLVTGHLLRDLEVGSIRLLLQIALGIELGRALTDIGLELHCAGLLDLKL